MEKTPCEYIVWNILPAIRKEFAKSMMKNHSFNQKQVAEILDLTPSAVSQYLSQKRGGIEITDKDLMLEVNKSVNKIIKDGNQHLPSETCRICSLLKLRKLALKNIENCKGCKIFCETAVWDILPVIRKEFANNLIDIHKFTQKKVAELLGISEASVSRYRSKKRGNIKITDDKIINEIHKSIEKIIKGDAKSVLIETCRICTLIKSSKK